MVDIQYKYIDEKLCSYLDYLRVMGIAVSDNQKIAKAIELLPILKEKSYHSLFNYCHRFLERKILFSKCYKNSTAIEK